MSTAISRTNILNKKVASTSFFRRYWRKRPRLFRKALRPDLLAAFDADRFYSWCKPPAIARIFMRTEEKAPGTARAGIVSHAPDAAQLYKHYRQVGEQLTLLLNSAETTAPEIGWIREAFGVGQAWRYDDVAATLSTLRSGIGFHAGHEDGFIVQLRGRREWSLWGSRTLPIEYVKYLLGDNSRGVVLPPPRPCEEPVLRVYLSEGDVLYIPSLMPHEGITIEESISLSVGWRGLSPFGLLTSMSKEFSGNVLDRVQKHSDAFFRLMPDYRHDGEPAAVDLLLRDLMDSLRLLGSEAPDENTIRSFLETLVSYKGDSQD